MSDKRDFPTRRQAVCYEAYGSCWVGCHTIASPSCSMMAQTSHMTGARPISARVAPEPRQKNAVWTLSSEHRKRARKRWRSLAPNERSDLIPWTGDPK